MKKTRDPQAIQSILLLGFLAANLGFESQSTAGTAFSTGFNLYGQTNTSAVSEDLLSVASGREFSLGLTSSGALVGWGLNRDGRCAPPKNLGKVISISGGIFHSLALKPDGTVVGWGLQNGNLLRIPQGATNALAIAAGGYHSLALMRDGTVVGWGFGGNGRTTPPASLTDVISIDAGRDHSVALKANGTVVSWGLNDFGQTNVPAGLSGVIAIAAGESHTLALKQDGSVVAWGKNTSGESTVPRDVASITSIAAGANFSLALKTDGSVVGWGDNTQGQLNLKGNDFRAIAAKGWHSLAIRGNGPLISSQPTGKTVLDGDSVQFSASAVGPGLTYQWYYNGQAVDGATAPTLALKQVSRANAGIYRVQATSATGTSVSANAVLVVRALQQLSTPEPLVGGGLRLSFGDPNEVPLTASSLARYGLESSPDLVVWNPIPLPLQLISGRLVVDLPAAIAGGNQFFRVVEK
jgi:hypothetical protein